MKWLIGILVLLAIALAVPYWLAGRGEVPFDDTARAKAPGQFIDLSAGKIHYMWRGPETGPVIVMAHGFSTPHFIFEQNAASLAANGFRVLQFDHFGRGWSDRPKATYDADFYDRELVELMDGLGLTEPVGLVGLSMGGPITAEFTARRPERVGRLFLFVPAGLETSGQTGTRASLMKAPLIGDWMWQVLARPALLGDPQYDESGLDPMHRLQGDVTEQMKYKGYFPALHSTFRNYPMYDREDIFTRLSETGVPVYAVYGGQDPTVPPENADRLQALIPAAEVRVAVDGDHGLNYKLFEKVNPWLVEFFLPMLPPAPEYDFSEPVAPEEPDDSEISDAAPEPG